MMQLPSLQGRRPVTNTELGIVVALGLVVGLVLGYVLMGTAHAIFEIGAEEHYKHTGAAARR